MNNYATSSATFKSGNTFAYTHFEFGAPNLGRLQVVFQVDTPGHTLYDAKTVQLNYGAKMSEFLGELEFTEDGFVAKGMGTIKVGDSASKRFATYDGNIQVTLSGETLTMSIVYEDSAYSFSGQYASGPIYVVEHSAA